MFQLKQVMEVYDKKLPEGAKRVWQGIFSGRERDDCLSALDYHIKHNKYSPRPADIEEIIEEIKKGRGELKAAVYVGNDPLTRRAVEQLNEDHPPASARIHTAWCIYHRLIFGGDPPIGGQLKTVSMTKGEALEIVNEQAAKYNMPEAIAPEYRIESYWNAHEYI